MEWWKAAGAVALILLAFVLLTPNQTKINGTVVEEQPSSVVIKIVDENGNPTSAEVWYEVAGERREVGVVFEANVPKGAKVWAKRIGYLENAVYADENKPLILLRDPYSEKVRVTVTGCAYFSAAPAGLPAVIRKPCGDVEIYPGRYNFVGFDENGLPTGTAEVLVRGGERIDLNGSSEVVGRIHTINGETGEDVEVFLTYEWNGVRIARYGSETLLPTCGKVYIHGPGYKKAIVDACAEENVVLNTVEQERTLVVSSEDPATEYIIVVSPDGAVLWADEGSRTRINNVERGVYYAYAVRGAAYAKTYVGTWNGTREISVERPRGMGRIVSKIPFDVYAYDDKISDHVTSKELPALTPIRIVIHGTKPEEMWLVLLPGEERVI